MTRFELRHLIDCDVETFWLLFLDSSLTESFFLDSLGFTRYETIERIESSDEIRHTVACEPTVRVPAPLRSILGPRLGYLEESVFVKRERICRFRWRPNTLAARMTLEGTLRAEPAPGGCVRIADVSVEARLPAIGRLVERSAETELRRAWGVSAEAMNTRIRFRA